MRANTRLICLVALLGICDIAEGQNGASSGTDKPAQVTGELGSPTATTTIPGNQLPPPDPKFGGVISEKAS